MNKHTPIPYDFVVADNAEQPIVLVVHAETRNTIARMGDRGLDPDCSLETDTADAEFIVRACNNHDKLVAALRGVVKLDDADKLFRKVGLDSVFNDARTALADATKETP